MTKRNRTTSKIEWRGILLIVRTQTDYLWKGQSHIEVYVARPKRTIIPITATGYRSHFIASEDLSLAGGAVAFVTAWLDREASTKGWAKAEFRWRQLSLF